MQREGRYPAPAGARRHPRPRGRRHGRACGDRVLAWQQGDRVFGLVGGGGLADRVVVHERCVTRVPDALDEAGAAAVEAFITAHDAAFTRPGCDPGETLLVHGARAAWARRRCNSG